MTDQDPDTGQFTSEDPQLFGLEGVERDAGFIPLPDPSAEIEPDSMTAEALQDALARAPESVIRSYVGGTELSADEPIQNPKESVSLERAARDLGDLQAKEGADAGEAEAQAIRDEVDELRGDTPEKKAAEAKAAEPPKEGEVEPDLERALNNPQIKEALAAQIGETESARQTYSNAVDVANQFARASFIEHFPEIAGLPLEQWEGALAAMSQREPARFNKAVGALQRVAQLESARQQQQQQSAEMQRVRLQAETAQFEASIKDVPRARRMDVEGEIVGALKERGANMDEVVKFLRSNEASSAQVMGLLWELGETRLQLKAIKSAPKAVASKPLPPVQRPGVATDYQSGIEADISSAERQLNRTGSLKDAERLLNAKLKRSAR